MYTEHDIDSREGSVEAPVQRHGNGYADNHNRRRQYNSIDLYIYSLETANTDIITQARRRLHRAKR